MHDHSALPLELPGQSILVTGGAGFIGSYLVRKLLSEGANVTVVDNLTSGKLENLPDHSNLRFLNFDLTDLSTFDRLSELCSAITGVVHLAANPSVTQSSANPSATHAINEVAAINLFNWAGKSGVKRVVFASTAAVYGDTTDLPVRESQHAIPLSPYGIDKLASEAYLAFFGRTYGFLAFPLRLMNVYGLGQSAAYAGVLTKFKDALDRGEDLTIFGDGTQTRDFIHVNDVVEAIAAALVSTSDLGTPMNIGTGRPTSLNDVLQVLAHGYEFKTHYKPFRDGEILHSYADVSRAQTTLGWQARVSLQTGLSSLFDRVLSEVAP